MAAPVLGGLLIADEVIDVFLPVLYFAVQKRKWARLHRLSVWNGLASTQHRQPAPGAGIVSAPASADEPAAS
jgi:Cu(I)/Ag(I) efflux system membrane protein CusA/SilA